MHPNTVPKLFIGLTLLTVAVLVGCGSAGPIGPNRYDLYLLIGQSNMAGRAAPTEVDRTPHQRVLMLGADGHWVVATEPMHFDKPKRVGVGPGLSFGKAMAGHRKNSIIGLIPAAAGGSPIAAWTPGGFHKQTNSFPYDDAIARARVAMTSGELKAILWHQGEADSRGPENVLQYQAALTEFADRIRRDLNAHGVPFIVGELGEFLKDDRPDSVRINRILRSVTDFIPDSGFVSADGLTDKGDQVHFSAKSARLLGRRYANKLIEMRADRH